VIDLDTILFNPATFVLTSNTFVLRVPPLTRIYGKPRQEAMSEIPRTISRIAADHGLRRDEVKFLIVEHRIPTYRLATATVVHDEHWPRLKARVERFAEVKRGREAMLTAVV
jgi:hypothetical protein